MGRESSRAGCSEQHCTSVKGAQQESAAVERMACQMVEGASPQKEGWGRGDALGAKRL